MAFSFFLDKEWIYLLPLAGSGGRDGAKKDEKGRWFGIPRAKKKKQRASRGEGFRWPVTNTPVYCDFHFSSYILLINTRLWMWAKRWMILCVLLVLLTTSLRWVGSFFRRPEAGLQALGIVPRRFWLL